MSSAVPFADPLWLSRGYSPYYNESHRRLQREAREYVDTYIAPFCEDWESQGSVPPEVRNVRLLQLLARTNNILPFRFIGVIPSLDILQ